MYMYVVTNILLKYTVYPHLNDGMKALTDPSTLIKCLVMSSTMTALSARCSYSGINFREE